ncbi:thiamine phosphate synthase [Reichenbachiella agariperforans]|uniref:thiamine phosphate synthase n=1 Tax=Reichenbachiella agariperforans TaxID=156994 RepID=UPI001C08FAFB|nr:thiamine phosphate synthase [Reichenbachiella agariperforans]MBU2916264.1 thiamine phosphate synthase [Reichenbachiella agariperforans]
MISRLHYISQETADKSHLQNIEEACQAGVDWVQLRVKNKSDNEVLAIATEAKEICKKHKAKLIINDHVAIAKKVKANGVHLGKEDMDPAEAREILGDRPYIGGTANTWEDVERLAMAGVDYIGLGPFRDTSTKENLSPTLGIKGISAILNNMIIGDIQVPIIAIGGIQTEDIFDLQLSGCHGVAVASLINLSDNKKETVNDINYCLPDGEF